jgi:hypothetical protein
MSDPKFDGIVDDEHEPSSEPIRARTDEGLKERERRGDFPNTLGPIGGEKRMNLVPLTDEQADALQEDEQSPDELAAHAKEREKVNSVQSWTETGRSDLPVDTSDNAKD